jgi:hypothetical protein
VKIYIEKLLATFSGFHQTLFRFLTARSPRQLFSQLTAHSSFFHSHSPTKQTLSHQVGFEAASPYLRVKTCLGLSSLDATHVGASSTDSVL